MGWNCHKYPPLGGAGTSLNRPNLMTFKASLSLMQKPLESWDADRVFGELTDCNRGPGSWTGHRTLEIVLRTFLASRHLVSPSYSPRSSWLTYYCLHRYITWRQNPVDRRRINWQCRIVYKHIYQALNRIKKSKNILTFYLIFQIHRDIFKFCNANFTFFFFLNLL